MCLDVASRATALIRCVIVPAPMPSIVIVAQNESVLGEAGLFGLVHVAKAVKFLADLALDNLVLLVLLVCALEVEVEPIVGLVSANVLMLLHVEGDGQNARQAEVGVLDVLAVYLLVHIK